MGEAGVNGGPGGQQAAFEVIAPAATRPVLLVCDHASNHIPARFSALGLDETQLARHIAYDIGVADVTRRLARRLQATAVLSAYSRLLIDPNRAPDDPTLIPQIGDGVVIPGNRDLTPEAREERRSAFMDPYHAAVAGELDRLGAGGALPALVSMHSFTPVMRGFERPWQVAALWNKDGRLPLPFMAKLRALGYTVGDNEPYSGRDLHGYTLHRHAEPRGLANLLIEIRQDLIDTHHGAEEWAELLGVVLGDLLADPALTRREPAA